MCITAILKSLNPKQRNTCAAYVLESSNFEDYTFMYIFLALAIKANKCSEKKDAELEVARWLRRALKRLKSRDC